MQVIPPQVEVRNAAECEGIVISQVPECTAVQACPPEDLRMVLDPPIEVVKRILKLAAPILLASVLAFSAQTITNSFVGRRLGPQQFAHYTIGISVANLFGYSIGIGLNGALDTFISQAFGRDGQATKDIGHSVQRATVLSLICAIPLAFLFVFGGPFYRFVFGEELGNGALLFTQYAFPNLVFCFLKDILTKTLQAINLPRLVLYSAFVSSASCLILNYFFTTSIPSAVLVLTTSDAIQLLVLLALTRWHTSVTFWHHCEWPSREAYDTAGLALFLTVGIPACISVCAQWWAFEALDIVAASISVEAVATVNLIMMSVGLLYFAMALAVGVSTCVLVGNALGENRPALALQYAKLGFGVDQSLNLCNALILVVFRRYIARVFTTDPEVEDYFSSVIFVVVLYVWGDSTQFTLQSIHKAAGEQKAGARAAVLSLWAVGLPTAVLLGKWVGLGGIGVIAGIICGVSCCVPQLLFNIARWDWEALALKASKRLSVEGEVTVNADKEAQVQIIEIQSVISPRHLKNGEDLPTVANDVIVQSVHDKN